MKNLVVGRLVFLDIMGYTEKYTPIFAGEKSPFSPLLGVQTGLRTRCMVCAKFFAAYGRQALPGPYETTIFREAFMRFHIMHKKINQAAEEYRVFFETDSIDEAKDFAMRLAFDETNNVYVQDTKRDEIVRDFDALVYRI